MNKNEKTINKIGIGVFGVMYSGIKDEEAVRFLLEKRFGEIIGAITREGFADIDLVYGIGGAKMDTAWPISRNSMRVFRF